jgi:hypothetical protein
MASAKGIEIVMAITKSSPTRGKQRFRAQAGVRRQVASRVHRSLRRDGSTFHEPALDG